jgi:hypothetical protein
MPLVALFKRPRQAAAPSPQPAAAPPQGPPVDPLAGDAVAHRFRAELAEGRWQAQYFRDGQVGAEIWRAADRSVRSPRYQPDQYTPSDRNIFAMCFFLMRDYQAQLEQMRLIGPLIQASPWRYQGDPGWAYERARTSALRAIGVPQGVPGPGSHRAP